MNTKLSRRARLLAGIGAGAVILAITATACDSTPTAAPAPHSTATSAPTTGTTAPTTTNPAPVAVDSTAPATPKPTSSTKPAPVPTLGKAQWAGGETRGYGAVRPTFIDNGGDGSGVVTDVKWQSWGGSTAIGTGVAADGNDASKPLADAPMRTATVEAFDLGMCDGKLMYRAVEWYFPSDGDKFDPNSYINICTGTFVGQR